MLVFLALPLIADPQSDYERLKADIAEQKRALTRYERQHLYAQALALQDTIAASSQRALEIALQSPEISDASAYSFHVGVLRDAGKTELALAALDAYAVLPLLEREQLAEVWRRRAEIYRVAGDEQALACYRRAGELVGKPREVGWYKLDAARMLLDLGRPDQALAEIATLPQLMATLDPAQQDSMERDRQSVLERAYREKGDAAGARLAKRSEMELRLRILQRELAEFDQKYPAPGE